MSGFARRSTSDNLQEKIIVVLNWSVHEAMEGMCYLDPGQSKEPLAPSSPGPDILTKLRIRSRIQVSSSEIEVISFMSYRF